MTSIQSLLGQLEGTQTIESIMSLLGVSRQQATYRVFRLSKEGYVLRKRLSDNRRVYSISAKNKLGAITPYEIINHCSPLKVHDQGDCYFYDVDLERTILFAVKKRSVRLIISALCLFRKIKDFERLFFLAKQESLEREVGLLYELSRKYFRTRKAKPFILRAALPKKGDPVRYLIAHASSREFEELQKRWRVNIPFTQKDLEEYSR